MVSGTSDDRALWLAQNVLPYERRLRAQLRRWHLPDDLDADEVVQEAYSYFAAMESVDYIRNPGSYLFSIARTNVLMHVRRAKVVSIRAVQQADSLIIADEPSPEVQVSDREQLHQLALAVAEMREPDRSAFLMRVMEELPHRAIGKQLGMSENAVQKSVARSLLRLMEMMGRGGNHAGDASKEEQRRTKQEPHAEKRDECGD